MPDLCISEFNKTGDVQCLNLLNGNLQSHSYTRNTVNGVCVRV